MDEMQHSHRVAARARDIGDNRLVSFLDAYLVAENSMDAPPVGVVRKDGNVWRILRFGVPADQQPSEVFATRREAGARLMELASRV